MNERKLHPFEYLSIFTRHKRWVIVPFVTSALVGLLVALLWPSTYRSGAMIAVQAPNVSPELISARTALDRDERVRALTQQLRSPAVLERVAREEGLTVDTPIDEVVHKLLQNITVELPKPLARSDRAPELNSFEIVYRDRTPERTRRVTNRLAQVFVDEHSRSREAQAEDTAEFLAAQLRTSEQRIADLEARLRAAKETHMGQLPEQTAANLQTLSGVRQQLESTSNSLRSEQDRLSLIERQMQAMKQGLYSAGIGTPAVASTPQQRVAAIQRELAAARSKYTDKHPEVLYLEEELKAARQEATMARQQPASSRDEMLAGDPGYQQLQAERNLTVLRIRGLQRAEAQLQSDIGRYQRRVEQAPMVEQELASLTRAYEFERENYKQISEKHAAASVQEQLARTREGERFSVLNAAYLPDAPESPNRPRIILLALAFGLVLGLGAAFGRDYLDWSVRDARVLQDEFDVPVLAEIPRIRRIA